MKFIKTKTINSLQKQQLLNIWNKQYPVDLAYQSIQAFEDYLSSLKKPEHILIIDKESHTKGWLVKMIRDEKVWIALLLDSSIQKQGYGSQLLNRVKQDSPEIYAWVIDHNKDKKADGNSYQSPLGFYLKNGFITVPKIRLEQAKLSAVKIKWQKK